MKSETRVRLEIYGRVQGVFFRKSTKEKAEKFGLSGWVRNREDGSVEALLEGAREDVDRLVEWARGGPRRAQVERVEIGEEEYVGELEGFEVRR
jgi:acylphosphatase